MSALTNAASELSRNGAYKAVTAIGVVLLLGGLAMPGAGNHSSEAVVPGNPVMSMMGRMLGEKIQDKLDTLGGTKTEAAPAAEAPKHSGAAAALNSMGDTLATKHPLLGAAAKAMGGKLGQSGGGMSEVAKKMSAGPQEVAMPGTVGGVPASAVPILGGDDQQMAAPRAAPRDADAVFAAGTPVASGGVSLDGVFKKAPK